MSFSPPATRRSPRNGVSPNRRDLSPGGYRGLSPPPSYNGGRSPSPAQPHSRPRRQVNISNSGSATSIPLLELDANNPQPPLAGPEIDDISSDDKEIVVQPGVDDGFFSNGIPSVEDNNPDAESLPEKPKEPEPFHPIDVPEIPDRDMPDIGTRFNGNYPRNPEFPYAPGYGPGGYMPDYAPTEFGGTGSESIPDVNVYQHKKTLAQGMMDLALFSANANQLRYVLESYERHPYYYPSVIFISFSLLFQVAVGVGLIWNAHYNVKDKKEICIANKINNFTVLGIFLVTVINVFVSAFGVANPPTPTITTST